MLSFTFFFVAGLARFGFSRSSSTVHNGRSFMVSVCNLEAIETKKSQTVSVARSETVAGVSIGLLTRGLGFRRTAVSRNKFVRLLVLGCIIEDELKVYITEDS